MREFDFSIFADISKGLRKRSNALRSDAGATSIVNMKIDEFGIKPYEDVVALIDPAELAINGIVVDYPFPQVFKGKDIMLLVDVDSVYEVDTTTFTLTRLVLYDAYNPTVEKAITPDGVWHFADFYSTWFLYNGIGVVFKTNIDTTGFLPDEVFIQDEVTIGTGVNHKGRLVTAGFDPSNFWNENWQFALDCLAGNLPDGITAEAVINKNFVWWTMIANGDTLWQFFPELAFTKNDDNTFTIDNSRFLEAIERNDMGFMPVHFEGDIYKLKVLGEFIVVYGKNGIAVLKAVSGPAPTYGLIEYQDFGIYNRGAVGGDDKQHIFIDVKGQVWKVSADLSIELLDYSEFIQPILSDDLNINYDPNTQEYYIGGTDKSYLLGPQGLTEIHQLVTSVLNEGGTKGVFESTGVATSSIVSNIITIGNSALNTLTSVAADGEYEDGTTVAIDYRYDKQEAFVRTTAVDLNKMGWVRFNFSGLEFRVVITAPDFTKFNPSNIIVKWKNNDNRNIRGIHVN